MNNSGKYIVLNNQREIQIHYYNNFYLDDDFNIVETKKVAPKEFQSYDDYYSSLIADLKLLVLNAAAEARENTYGLITTISKGYDAAACAALAIELGCETAVTFDRPEKYAEDDGSEIAKRLGYKKIITKDASEYLNNNDFIEAEFLSSGELGTGIVFTAFEEEFSNNIVFMGERGDKLWDKNWGSVNSELKFDDEVFSGTSMIENRLKSGYIILPVPLYNAQSWPSIHKINNSVEMEKYSVGGNYDRPIPRRILEEKGIPRSEFGIEKKGAGFNYRFDNLNRLKRRMSRKSYESFQNFYQENRVINTNTIKLWMKYLWNTKDIYLNFIIKKIGISYRHKALSADSLSNPGAPSFLFHWGNQIMVNRYKKVGINRWWITKEV